MKAVQRTWLSIACFIPLAIILLATFACLPAPVGDPEKSKVDESLSGIYRADATQPPDPSDKTTQLAILRPWDDKTYLLEIMTTGMRNDKEVREIAHYKAWLTSLGDRTFLCAQPMDDLRFTFGDDGTKPYWLVLRLDKIADGLEVRPVKPDSEFLKDLTKQAEIEAAIKAHATDQPLYSATLIYRKLGKASQGEIDEVLSKFDTSRSAK